MKFVISWAVLITLMYTAQTSLLTYINYNGVSVNLMLLLTVSTAFVHGYDKGVAMGFATGLLQDLTAGGFFGCATLSYMIIGFVFGKFSGYIFKEQLFFPIASAPLAAAMHFLIMTGLIYMLGYKINIIQSIESTLMPFICYQIFFSWMVHKVVCDFNKFAKRHG